MGRVSIDPITRLEGHGRIEIFLNDAGEVANVYFQVPELRGFERFCVGRLAEEMPVITNRICGVCPEAHHMASVKALDRLFDVEPPLAAKRIRELLYMSFFVTDHATHFFALGGPDFIVGPDAPAAQRNLLGVIGRVGLDAGRRVIECRRRNHDVIKMLGGRSIHPAAGVPGGWSKAISPEELSVIRDTARWNIDFAQFSLKAFDDIVLRDSAYVDLITADTYLHRTYSMGLVDADNRVNFYDGTVRVVDPEGRELVKYSPSDYPAHIAERVEHWSYLKFPYLKAVGWKGFVDGAESGIYCATPLSRLNVSDRMATPRAQQEFERFYETFGSKRTAGRFQPVHYRLATHWARLIELLYAAERMCELAADPDITAPDVRAIPTGAINPQGGVGCVEAPRGTLTHHYVADATGVLTKVNLVVGTTNNHAPIAMSLERAARSLIRPGRAIDDGLLNRIEMAFRVYDPCLSCATHSLPGQMPLVIDIKQPSGHVVQTIRRD
jgi:F420-non-reducing hydrogenase large subunit